MADSGGVGGGGSGGSGSSSGEKMIALVSSNNSARFEVREAAALLSQTVRRMIDEGAGAAAGAAATGDGILLPNVDAETLAKVLEYCDKHAPASSSAAEEAAPPGEDLESFDREFMRVDTDTLYSLTMAASYLEIEGLKDLTCQTIADMIKGKTTEQIRQILGITNDFTPEEEEEARRDNAWAGF